MKTYLNQPQFFQARIETPLGLMVAIANEQYLLRLDFAERHLEIDARKIQVAPLDLIRKELEQYFKGKLTQFTTPVKLIGTDFQKNVWQALQNIPFGKTCSYLQLAIAVKKPTAYRAAANANGANPLSIIVPCHRVINHNGQLGGYSSGLDRKKFLLKHEGVYDETL